MSVPVDQRSHGQTTAAVKASKLCSYLFEVKKHFPKEHYQLTDRIVHCALDIYVKCWEGSNPTNYFVYAPKYGKPKTQLIRSAYIGIMELTALMNLAYPIFEIPSDKVVHWDDILTELKNSITEWLEEEESKFYS